MTTEQYQANKNLILLRTEIDKQMKLTAIASLMEAPNHEMNITDSPIYGADKTNDKFVEVTKISLSEDNAKINYYGIYYESGDEANGSFEIFDDVAFDWCDILYSINDWCSGNYSNE